MNYLEVFRIVPGVVAGLFVGLAACTTAGAPPDGFGISNLRVGKVCGTYGGGDICEQTYDIVNDDHGICMYNHQVRNCTWFGYSFDHTPIDHDITLDCQETSDQPRDLGNPEGVLARHTKSVNFQLVVPAGGSHFFNPQYSSGGDRGTRVQTETESCSYHGKILFQFTRHFHAPAAGT